MAHVFFGDRLEQEHPEHCAMRVAEHLSGCGGLVMLDNFETVARDPELLRWLAQVRPPGRVLIATREAPTGLRGRVIEGPRNCTRPRR